MQTNNKKFLDLAENKKYYSKSDGNYMDINNAFYAHKVLPRVNWLRDKVYQVGSQKHLDIGCKDGYTGLTFQSEGIDYIGVDPSEDAIDEATLRAKEANLDSKFICSFIEDLSDEWINENYSETVSMMEVLEHVIDPDLVIQKLCKMGMYIMITTPEATGRHGLVDADRNEEHVRIYTKEELETLISKYGKIIESVLIDDQICILFKPL